MNEELLQREAFLQFNEAVGRAISAFGTIEMLLCNHFTLLTQLQPPMAKALFFSTRSLRGRLDLLDAAITTVESAVDYPSLVPFLKTASKRTAQWASVRNMLAHSTVVKMDWKESKFHGCYILYDSSSSDWPDPKSALTIDELENAALNFGRLSALLLAAHSHTMPLTEPRLKECRELVQLFPTNATESERRLKVLKRFEQLIPAGNYHANV